VTRLRRRPPQPRSTKKVAAFQQGRKWWFRLHEKGGKHHELPAHHRAEEFMDAYLDGLRVAGAGSNRVCRSMRTAAPR